MVKIYLVKIFTEKIYLMILDYLCESHVVLKSLRGSHNHLMHKYI